MIFSNSSSVKTSAVKPGSGLTERRFENSGLLNSPEWVSWKMKRVLGFTSRMRWTNLVSAGWFLGMMNSWFMRERFLSVMVIASRLTKPASPLNRFS